MGHTKYIKKPQPQKIAGIQNYEYFDQKIRINIIKPNQRIKIYY